MTQEGGRKPNLYLPALRMVASLLVPGERVLG